MESWPSYWMLRSGRFVFRNLLSVFAENVVIVRLGRLRTLGVLVSFHFSSFNKLKSIFIKQSNCIIIYKLSHLIFYIYLQPSFCFVNR